MSETIKYVGDQKVNCNCGWSGIRAQLVMTYPVEPIGPYCPKCLKLWEKVNDEKENLKNWCDIEGVAP